MFAICGGMPRAGSTLHYQIVCHLVETHLGGARLGFIHSGLLCEVRREVLDNRWRIIKTYTFDSGVQALVDEGRAKVFYIYRDVRDVLASMLQRRAPLMPPPHVLLPRIIQRDAIWKAQASVFVHRFEDVVADVPKAVRAMAAHLGIALRTHEADAIARSYSLEANRQRVAAIVSRPKPPAPFGLPQTAGLPATTFGHPVTPLGLHEASMMPGSVRDIDGVDLHTLLRWDHIGTGQPGAWRTVVSADDLERVRPVCTEWLIANGYETDGNWGVTNLDAAASVDR